MDLDAKQDAYDLIDQNWDTNRIAKPDLRIEDDTSQGQGRRMPTNNPTLTFTKRSENITYTNVRKTHVRVEMTVRITFYMDSDDKDTYSEELKRVLTVNNTRHRGLDPDWNRITLLDDSIDIEDPIYAIDENGYIDVRFIRSSVPVKDAYAP